VREIDDAPFRLCHFNTIEEFLFFKIGTNQLDFVYVISTGRATDIWCKGEVISSEEKWLPLGKYFQNTDRATDSNAIMTSNLQSQKDERSDYSIEDISFSIVPEWLCSNPMEINDFDEQECTVPSVSQTGECQIQSPNWASPTHSQPNCFHIIPSFQLQSTIG
jgi:hypothetical protein